MVHWSFLLNFVWRWAASEVDEQGLEGCKVFFWGVTLVTFMLSSILFTAVVNLITPMEGVTKKKCIFWDTLLSRAGKLLSER